MSFAVETGRDPFTEARRKKEGRERGGECLGLQRKVKSKREERER